MRASPAQVRSGRRLEVALVATVLLLVLFAPMVAIHMYGAVTEAGARTAGGEVTVGIAVILRATARRLLRGASTGLMRTAVGALGRTSARALTRRLVKFTGRLFFSSLVQERTDDPPEGARSSAGFGSQAFALLLGYAGLCASFRGVLYVVEPRVASELLGGFGLGTLEAVLLAGAPLLAYALLHAALGRAFGVRMIYRTEVDGLLLQAYFTGAGSFLPLTTDVEYEGQASAKRWVATGSILGLFLVHLLLQWAGSAGASARATFVGSMFLVYAFVYCFPIKPLEGYFIWSSSRLQWLLVTLPILAAFLYWLPPAFGEIL